MSRRSSHCVALVAQDLAQRPLDVGTPGPPRRLAMLRGEGGRAIEQAQGHALRLGALAGEEEDGVAARRGPCPRPGPRRARPAARAPSAASSSSRSRPRATARCSKAVRVVAREKATSAGSSSGFSLRWVARRCRRLAQGRLGLGREDERAAVRAGRRLAAAAPPAASPGTGSLGRRLLQDHVGVGAADAEGGDAGAARAAACLPARALGRAARSPPPPSRRCEEGASTCRVFGSSPVRASPRPS